MLIKSLCRKLPVIKSWKVLVLHMKRGNSCLSPYGRGSSPLSPTSKPTKICHYPLYWGKFLFAANPWIAIVLEWMNFFFSSLWPFDTQLLYTFAALSHQPWDHASPHPSSNSNLLEGCLKLAYHDPSPFCAFSHNAPSSWNVLPFHLPCWAHSYLSLGLRKMGQLGKAPQLLPDFWRVILCVQVSHLPDNTLTLSEQKGEFAPSRTCPLCLISYAVVQTKRV